VSLPSGLPGQKAATPLLAQRWATINPAHAVQRAAAVLTFSEEVPTLVVNRAVEAVRTVARSYGLDKEEPLNSMMVQIGPGGAQAQTPTTQEGISFQEVRGGQVVQALNITKQAVRFEYAVYTRWVGFREQLLVMLSQILPVMSNVTTMQSVALEYVDFFYAVNEGAEDVGLIVDNRSELVPRRAFRKREPFHAHSGWFTASSATGRNLINVDLTVADANGPAGLRRTISIRTHEAEIVADMTSPRALELMSAEASMMVADALHATMKERLGHVLTKDAKAMISLGS
jgi:uncharacterized protein (TIGR04255 family)